MSGPERGSERALLDRIRARRARLALMEAAKALNAPAEGTSRGRLRLRFIGGPLGGEYIEVPHPPPPRCQLPDAIDEYVLVREPVTEAEPIPETHYASLSALHELAQLFDAVRWAAEIEQLAQGTGRSTC
jgi:hypothetical protein